MDLYGPGSMTSTHTGNPVCAAAALASLEKIVREDLAGTSRRLAELLLRGLETIAGRHRDVVGRVSGRGLVAGLQMVRPGTKEPDPDLAFDVVERAFHKGLLLFAPVGAWGQTVKIAPPLPITRAALEEGITVLGEALDEAEAARSEAVVRQAESTKR
jgi:4-aminobutyrate aminotransferase-like enzyme